VERADEAAGGIKGKPPVTALLDPAGNVTLRARVH